jgi:hypothetical protein
LKYRFERRLRVFGQMIRLGIGGKLASSHVALEGINRLRD